MKLTNNTNEKERHDTIKLMIPLPFDMTKEEIKEMENGKFIVRRKHQ